jgi:hypothetical protein
MFYTWMDRVNQELPADASRVKFGWTFVEMEHGELPMTMHCKTEGVCGPHMSRCRLVFINTICSSESSTVQWVSICDDVLLAFESKADEVLPLEVSVDSEPEF